MGLHHCLTALAGRGGCCENQIRPWGSGGQSVAPCVVLARHDHAQGLSRESSAGETYATALTKLSPGLMCPHADAVLHSSCCLLVAPHPPRWSWSRPAAEGSKNFQSSGHSLLQADVRTALPAILSYKLLRSCAPRSGASDCAQKGGSLADGTLSGLATKVAWVYNSSLPHQCL